ncbi:MAG: hypothetical protein FWH22_01580 [Fibromonadales bacterium]|nr:hypothetical protein [Fibromonadales bacterium]
MENLLSVFNAIVLALTLYVNYTTRKLINKERFESTFFKMFENFQNLLAQITDLVNTKNAISVDPFGTACEKRSLSKHPKVDQCFNTLFQILKYINKSGIKDKTMYIDIIRPLLINEIFSLYETYVRDSNSNEHKSLFEKYFKNSQNPN